MHSLSSTKVYVLRFLAVSFCLIPLWGCGTTSVLRPADTLNENQFEIITAVAANNTGTILPAFRIDYGITNRIEVGAQYEIRSAFAGGRYAILSSDENDIALAVGLSVGQASYIANYDTTYTSVDYISSFTLIPNVTVGKRWDRWEVYLGYKAFIGTSYGYEIGTTKAGFRLAMGKKKKVSFLFEIGESHYQVANYQYLHFAEGSTGFAFRF